MSQFWGCTPHQPYAHLASSITNFRNFRLLDVRLNEHAVVVGENKIGKSNFLHALRLFIDGGRRGVAEASLGSANLLYIALKVLELERRTARLRNAKT
ncbi:MAG: AAA family ATPase [Acidobacteria bacterium]|nr:AAA family ATPase [Acidobacteriota bacterium]